MRLVACDLDGTLLRPDNSVSARTLAALEACDDAGITVIFVTGRPVRWMVPVVEATRRSAIAICSNGAVTVDLRDGRIIESWPLSDATVLAIASRLRAALPPVVFAADTLGGYGAESGYFTGPPPPHCTMIGSLRAILDQGRPPLKLLCRLAADPTASTAAVTADEMLKVAREVLDGIAQPVHSNPTGSLLEISAHGVSKATALARFVQSEGLSSSDVVAFGDMPNDIPMLQWAGRGYAMADGHREAIEAAGAVAPPCAEDGVAQVIEQLLARDGALPFGARQRELD